MGVDRATQRQGRGGGVKFNPYKNGEKAEFFLAMLKEGAQQVLG